MLKHVKAFMWGMIEFRSMMTRSYDDYELLLSYDRGRELAHRLTLRRFDHA